VLMRESLTRRAFSFIANTVRRVKGTSLSGNRSSRYDAQRSTGKDCGHATYLPVETR
jgi:hypothetical protein